MSAVAPPGRDSGARYLTLFTVSIAHDYYNDRDGRCTDLRALPTPACAALMTSLGLVFREFGAGFSLLVPDAKAAALAGWVAAGGGGWTWLSFLLVPSNPNFVSISALPIDLDPRRQALHLSNLAAVGGAGGVGIDATGTAPLLPTTGAEFAVATPSGRTASLVDLSGALVEAPCTAAGGEMRFDLSGFAHGLYSARFATAAGKPVPTPRKAAGTVDRLYVPGVPAPLAVLDLVLARPDGVDAPTAAFPLQGEKVRPVSLQLSFAARETVWRYFVIAQGRSASFGQNLAIEGEGASFSPGRAALPNGDAAVTFTASAALPLRRRSPYRFRLTGERRNANGGRDAVVVDPLPTAPPAPVWPAENGGGGSEIYVYV